MNTAIRLL